MKRGGGKAASGNGRARSGEKAGGGSSGEGGARKPPRKSAAATKERKAPAKRARSAKPKAAEGNRAANGRGRRGKGGAAVTTRRPVGVVEGTPVRDGRREDLGLTASEARLLDDLFAIVEEHKSDSAVTIDRDELAHAFVFACEHHADQRRKSGEDFITHPVGVAKICAGMRLDTETLCAALLHDTVEDTSASLEEVREQFGDEIASLVDGVTKLTGITFQSRDEAQAENYRKMMVAMASDIRVILIKLADRLHNMRTLGAMPKQKQIDKAKETLDIYAPDRAPPGHPRDQVGARGPRLRHPAPAQVPGDQDPGRPAARRARALRGQGGRLPAQGAVGPASTRRSPAGPSTSTRSTRR